MSVSYAVSERFSPRLALWVAGSAIYHLDAVVSKALRYTSIVAQFLWLVAVALMIADWKGKPSPSALLVAGKALALFGILAGAVIIALLNPVPVACLVGTIAAGYITYPR